MSYTTERDLKQKVDDIITGKILPVIEIKIKQQMSEMVGKGGIVFEGKKYYLKDNVDKGLRLQAQMFAKMFSDQVQSYLVDLNKINSTRDVLGRETRGQRLYHQEKIEKYVDDVLSTVKF